MKVLTILSAVLAVATSYPVVTTWTLSELSNAIETKKHPDLLPYLEDALNQIMKGLFTGNNLKLIHVVIPSPSGQAAWTVDELQSAVEDHNISEEYRTAILQAHGILKNKIAAGEVMDTVEVIIPAMDISIWSASDVNEALSSVSTKPELIPYLEKASDELKKTEEDGFEKETVGMVTPVGYIPHKADYQYLPKGSKHLIKKTVANRLP